MKNLTFEQKKIVNKLINEFTKLNDNSKDCKFNLLNYNLLNAEKDGWVLGKNELIAHNDSMKSLFVVVMNDIAKMLMCDIQNGKLPLHLDVKNNSIHIKHISTVSYTNDDIYIYLVNKFDSTEFGSKIIGHEFSYSNVNSRGYQTIQEMVGESYFQNRLMKLIKKGLA